MARGKLFRQSSNGCEDAKILKPKPYYWTQSIVAPNYHMHPSIDIVRPSCQCKDGRQRGASPRILIWYLWKRRRRFTFLIFTASLSHMTSLVSSLRPPEAASKSRTSGCLAALQVLAKARIEDKELHLSCYLRATQYLASSSLRNVCQKSCIVCRLELSRRVLVSINDNSCRRPTLSKRVLLTTFLSAEKLQNPELAVASLFTQRWLTINIQLHPFCGLVPCPALIS